MLPDEGHQYLYDRGVVAGRVASDPLQRIDASQTDVELVRAELFDRFGVPVRDVSLTRSVGVPRSLPSALTFRKCKSPKSDFCHFENWFVLFVTYVDLVRKDDQCVIFDRLLNCALRTVAPAFPGFLAGWGNARALAFALTCSEGDGVCAACCRGVVRLAH